MARRSVLSATERASLLVLPDTQDDLIRHYSFNESDWALIRQRRGDSNRLGFAVQLCLLRYPGYALVPDGAIAESVIQWIAGQIKTDPALGENTASAMKHGANISRNCAAILDYRPSDYLISGFL